jgi:uncharacterized protein (DUF885 family)
LSAVEHDDMRAENLHGESGDKAMSDIDPIAVDYVDEVAALDPLAATWMGVAGHESELPDFSPDGAKARADLDRRTLRALEAAVAESDRDRLARDVMVERLRLSGELFEADEHLYDLNILASPMQRLRGTFDLMPTDGADAWAQIADRMEGLPEAMAGLRASLDEGSSRGLTAAARQVRACIAQADAWSGSPSFFEALVDKSRAAPLDAALRSRLAAAAGVGAGAYAAWAAYLRDEYLPRARIEDGVGPERYALRARVFTGLDLDLAETYAWGWEEVRRIRGEMAETARAIVPDGDLDAAVHLLETDAARAVEGEGAFLQWMQATQDRTIAELDGVHFEIPGPVRTIEAMFAPPGGALAMYYTGPSEDFSRPGRTWYPTGGRTRFPLWTEVSVAYHEGVPGHHLQIAMARYQGESLTRYQRLLAGTSGYVEGWALYAERLMAELGYLNSPDSYLGYLSSQGLRAARVVVDIGLHLGLRLPEDEPEHAGEVWEPRLALSFLRKHCFFGEDMLSSEVDRYLGFPGQAISYKIGERAWLRAREASGRALGQDFELKDFHARALAMGPVGLDQLEREMARVPDRG